MRCRRGLAALVPLLAAVNVAADGGRAQAQVPVDLELVLAVDASGSVDDSEFRLQVGGIAAGFRDPQVIEAIGRGYAGQIAVAVLVWSDAHTAKDAGEWYVIRNADDAEAFALVVQHWPRRVRNGATGIGAGLGAAMQMMDFNGLSGARRVVDVSGDGVETPLDTDLRGFGMLLDGAREMAAERGVTVNGLAIVKDVPNLDEWYDNNVRMGSGSFVMRAEDYEDFAEAMRAKLLKEIDQTSPVTLLEPSHSPAGPAASPGG